MSTLIFPDNLDFSRPFHFSEEQQPRGARIGGNMPEGLSIDLHDYAEYFGTFPLILGASPLSCSIFINCRFSELLLALNQGPQSDNRIVAVVHEDTSRSTSNRLSRYDGLISGNWPFGDGMFNFFWRYPFAGEEYYWYVQG